MIIVSSLSDTNEDDGDIVLVVVVAVFIFSSSPLSWWIAIDSCTTYYGNLSKNPTGKRGERVALFSSLSELRRAKKFVEMGRI